MSLAIAAFAICFVIAGWGIPVYAPSLMLDRQFVSRKVRIGASIGLLAWAAALSYSVVFVLSALTK